MEYAQFPLQNGVESADAVPSTWWMKQSTGVEQLVSNAGNLDNILSVQRCTLILVSFRQMIDGFEAYP